MRTPVPPTPTKVKARSGPVPTLYATTEPDGQTRLAFGAFRAYLRQDVTDADLERIKGALRPTYSHKAPKLARPAHPDTYYRNDSALKASVVPLKDAEEQRLVPRGQIGVMTFHRGLFTDTLAVRLGLVRGDIESRAFTASAWTSADFMRGYSQRGTKKNEVPADALALRDALLAIPVLEYPATLLFVRQVDGRRKLGIGVQFFWRGSESGPEAGWEAHARPLLAQINDAIICTDAGVSRLSDLEDAET